MQPFPLEREVAAAASSSARDHGVEFVEDLKWKIRVRILTGVPRGRDNEIDERVSVTADELGVLRSFGRFRVGAFYAVR